LGGEGDLVPGGALPAELVHERLHLREESGGRDGVSVLDGPSFAKEGIRGVQVGAGEGFSHGFAREDVVSLINSVGDIEKPVPLGLKLLREVPEFRRMAARATWALLTG
jgi:hypothetical protein